MTADLPGLTKGDINLSVEEGVLTLTGERKSDTLRTRNSATATSELTASSAALSNWTAVLRTERSRPIQEWTAQGRVTEGRGQKPFEVSIAE
ncbi:MAG: hypothetical protein Ct9H300mP7_6560 [Verrucomicrobiota bacterium]|nr:MAG: hypothetical protein Ct9H300mP7_6560 [Verrucomicrobiota bacterium]